MMCNAYFHILSFGSVGCGQYRRLCTSLCAQRSGGRFYCHRSLYDPGNNDGPLHRPYERRAESPNVVLVIVGGAINGSRLIDCCLFDVDTPWRSFTIGRTCSSTLTTALCNTSDPFKLQPGTMLCYYIVTSTQVYSYPHTSKQE